MRKMQEEFESGFNDLRTKVSSLFLFSHNALDALWHLLVGGGGSWKAASNGKEGRREVWRKGALRPICPRRNCVCVLARPASSLPRKHRRRQIVLLIKSPLSKAASSDYVTPPSAQVPARKKPLGSSLTQAPRHESSGRGVLRKVSSGCRHSSVQKQMVSHSLHHRLDCVNLGELWEHGLSTNQTSHERESWSFFYQVPGRALDNPLLQPGGYAPSTHTTKNI